jgi:hypothetical protein
MPINSVQVYIQNLINGLIMPGSAGTGMLDLGDRIWKMTHPQGSECDFVTFRWGMMIVHKRSRA